MYHENRRKGKLPVFNNDLMINVKNKELQKK